MAKTRTRHRPPRIFIKNKKIYVRIGKKRYLLKDQKKYSREQLIDIILKNLLVRRKRRSRGKLTKREKKLNLQDMKTFEAFEKLNRGRSGNLVLPSGLDKTLSSNNTERSFYNALVKFSGKMPKDINIVNRTPLVVDKNATKPKPSTAVAPTFTEAEYRKLKAELGLTKSQLKNSGRAGNFAVDLLAVERKVKEKNRKKTDLLLPWKNSLEGKYGITIDAKVTNSMTDFLAKLANAYPKGLADDDFYNDYLVMRTSLFDTTAAPSSSSGGPPPGAPPPAPGMIGPPPAPGPPGMLAPPVAQVPAPLPMFSFTSDSEMKKPEKAEYQAVKKSTIDKFKKSQLVAKKKLLQKLIDDNKLPIEIDRYKIIASGLKKGQRSFDGAKSAEDLAQDIFEYYERTDGRSTIPSVFNAIFPEGVNAVKAPPSKKPAKKKPAPPSLTHEEELALALRKRSDAIVTKEQQVDDDSLPSKETTQEREREEAGRALLAGIKLKKLPPSITTEDPRELVDPDDVVPPLEDIDQTAAGVVIRAMVGKRDSPLSTDEIDNMLKNTKGFIGTYPANFLKFLPKRLPKVFSFIMNTDPSNKPGEHWVAIRVDTRDENVVEYYDSFGEEPSKNFMKQLKKLINTLDVPIYLKLKINRIKDQNTNTNSCGWFAMNFIINRNLGKPFRECSGYDDSVAGEDNVEKMKSKFGYV
jgi:hypothetical protein